MSDLISRQDAIDAIKEFQHGAAEWRDEQEERSDIWHRADSAIASAIEIGLRVKKLPSAQQWIPCSERLPEPVAPSQRREWFITSNQYGSVTLTCYEFEASPFKEGWQTNMTILAWMPLPEPYKMDGKEKVDE